MNVLPCIHIWNMGNFETYFLQCIPIEYEENYFQAVFTVQYSVLPSIVVITLYNMLSYHPSEEVNLRSNFQIHGFITFNEPEVKVNILVNLKSLLINSNRIYFSSSVRCIKDKN